MKSIPPAVWAVVFVVLGLGTKCLAVHYGSLAGAADLAADGQMLFAAGLVIFQHSPTKDTAAAAALLSGVAVPPVLPTPPAPSAPANSEQQ